MHRFDTRCARILGHDLEEVVADLAQLAAMTHPDDVVRAREALVKYLRGETEWYETEYRGAIQRVRGAGSLRAAAPPSAMPTGGSGGCPAC